MKKMSVDKSILITHISIKKDKQFLCKFFKIRMLNFSDNTKLKIDTRKKIVLINLGKQNLYIGLTQLTIARTFNPQINFSLKVDSL